MATLRGRPVQLCHGLWEVGRREGREGRLRKLFLKEALKCVRLFLPSPQLKRLKRQNWSALGRESSMIGAIQLELGLQGLRGLHRSQQSLPWEAVWQAHEGAEPPQYRLRQLWELWRAQSLTVPVHSSLHHPFYSESL